MKFDDKEKVIFDIENLSNVSFMNTEITGDRFSDKGRWGGGGGGERFSFTAIKPGITVVKIIYKRQWENNSIKEKEFSFNII